MSEPQNQIKVGSIVYAATYNPCSLESENCVLSLHISEDLAKAAVESKRREIADWYERSANEEFFDSIIDGKIPSWVLFEVIPMELMP